MKNKIELWSGFSKEDRILLASLLDKYRIYEKTGIGQCSHFLNPYQQEFVTKFLDEKKISYKITKCHDLCEQVVVSFGKKESPVTIYWGETEEDITHKDILGTLFSIGFEKETIGDIFLEKGGFYLTNLTRMNSFLEEHLLKIKNTPVTLKKVEKIHLEEKRFQALSLIVSSMRLDQMVSRLAKKSRAGAKELLKEKKVIVNYHVVENPSYLLREGDVLSIRGVGKFKFGKKIKDTKKQKEWIEVWKYQ